MEIIPASPLLHSRPAIQANTLQIPQIVEDFIKKATIPDLAEEKFLLAWELCKSLEQCEPNESGLRRAYKNAKDSLPDEVIRPFQSLIDVETAVNTKLLTHWVNKFLEIIFNDLDHLDMSLIDVHWEHNSYPDIITFQRICNFASKHFKGNELSVLGIDYLMNYPECLEALCNLLSNSNLTSIRFEKIYHLGEPVNFSKVINAIAENHSVTALHFKKCALSEIINYPFIGALEKMSSLKELDLEANFFSPISAAAFINTNTLSSFNFTGNYQPADTSVVEALEKNHSLIEFTADWQNDELREQGMQYVYRNHLENNPK